MTKKVEKTEIWGCDRCKITSESKDRMCPCPRGGCDAEIIGEKIVTTEIILKKTKHNLIKYDRFNITGRGTVFAVNMVENNIENIKIGDIVSIEDDTNWEVISIEGIRRIDRIPTVGLIVKPLEELK